MKVILEDGSGSGFKAKVDSANRVLTRAVSLTEQNNQTRLGRSYNIGTGVVTLTNSADSGVLYFKNNEADDILITGINISSTSATGSASKVMLVKTYQKATGLSAGSTVMALNSNYGSSRDLTADIKVGQTNATVTNGTPVGAFHIPLETFFYTAVSWIIPKGTTIAVSVTPPTSNTSLSLSVTVEAMLISKEV